jgi:hypothetical protein
VLVLHQVVIVLKKLRNIMSCFCYPKNPHYSSFHLAAVEAVVAVAVLAVAVTVVTVVTEVTEVVPDGCNAPDPLLHPNHHQKMIPARKKITISISCPTFVKSY